MWNSTGENCNSERNDIMPFYAPPDRCHLKAVSPVPAPLPRSLLYQWYPAHHMQAAEFRLILAEETG